MSIINSQPLIGASGQGGGYNLTNSLRFRSSASAYLSRTLTTPTNSQKWTFSDWVKRGNLASNQFILQAGNSVNDEAQWYFQTDNTIRFYQYTGSYQYDFTTAQVFRDPSAWYHLVVQYDSTEATTANRFRVYINGSQITLTTSTSVSLNATNSKVNSAVSHDIGGSNIENRWFDGYMDEINFIDGQALTPTSFGSFNALTGVWQPARYTGTYGTNGFYLPFTDNSALTTSSNVGLGKDFSGNGNYWTTNNISITAGATYDSMTDVPTLTSATTANYCVMNPLTTGTTTTLSGANLNLVQTSGSNVGNSRSTFAMQTGKWYFETTLTANSIGIYPQLGIMTAFDGSRPNNDYPQAGYPSGSVNPTQSVIYMADGQKQTNGSSSSYGASFTNGDVIGIAIDSDNGAIYFSKNGTFQNSGVPTSGATKTGAALTWTGGTVEHVYSIAGYSNLSQSVNFGQRPFAYTPPTGFVALNTFNLPNNTIVAGNKQFNAVLWTGNGSSPRAFTGIGFAPDFAWIKSRSTAADHALIDSVRGTGAKALVSNTTSAENGDGLVINSFDSDGYTLATGTFNFSYANTNTASYVSWNWKAGGAAVTNTAGSISAQVSANTTSGFSIVTYTGNGSNSTVGHGLGVAPRMVIYKRRNAADSWVVYNANIGAANNLVLNSTQAQSGNGSFYWNSTAPTSSVISTGTDSAVNASGSTYVAYCFAQIAGYSAFGSYTGNGSSDGPFVYTGFRPRYIMRKRTDTTAYWVVFDTARNTYNVVGEDLYPNDSLAGSNDLTMDILSNGFKIRGSGSNINASGGTYIYMAFAESPFKYSLGR